MSREVSWRQMISAKTAEKPTIFRVFNEMILTTSATEQDERSFIPCAEYYDMLLAERNELNKQLDYPMGQLRLLMHKTFGASPEQATEQPVGQLGLLFNEAAAWMPKDDWPAESTSMSAHTQKKYSGALDGILAETIESNYYKMGLEIHEDITEKQRNIQKYITLLDHFSAFSVFQTVLLGAPHTLNLEG